MRNRSSQSFILYISSLYLNSPDTILTSINLILYLTILWHIILHVHASFSVCHNPIEYGLFYLKFHFHVHLLSDCVIFHNESCCADTLNFRNSSAFHYNQVTLHAFPTPISSLFRHLPKCAEYFSTLTSHGRIVYNIKYTSFHI